MQTADIKRVGIIGAGRIGKAMAQTALRAGRRVVIAKNRGAESLTSVVEALGDGVSAGTVKDAAAADIVVVAVHRPGPPRDLWRQRRRRPRRRDGAHGARSRRSAADPADAAVPDARRPA